MTTHVSPPRSPEYETLLDTQGRLKEIEGHGVIARGRLQVLQHRISEGNYLAILSVDEVNIPLGGGRQSRRTKRGFEVEIAGGRKFEVLLDGEQQETELFQRLLEHFTKFEGLKERGWAERIMEKGARGEDWVGKVGDRVNQRVVDGLAARQPDPSRKTREMKLGGKVTDNVLRGARDASEKGAKLTSGVTEKVSGKLGSALTGNPVVKNFRESPMDSRRKKFHDCLVAGMMTAGRVYVKADEKGKLIIESAGDGLGKQAGDRYGKEAEAAVRNLGRIGLNTYRIIRFPKKLGAKALIKGALKDAMKDKGTKARGRAV